MFTATDLKQYFYCPRILYYHHCLPEIRPLTDKMEAGLSAHIDETERETRRSVRTYGLTTAERHFDLWVESERLGIRGQMDLALFAPDGRSAEVSPVDYKLGKQVNDNWKIQIAIYALLLEENYPVTVKVGYLYLIPLRRAERIVITPILKHRAEGALAQMQQIAETEWMPNPTPHRSKCVDCEFRRFCNDV